MARTYAKLSTSLWGSRKYRKLATVQPKFMYVYLHSSPHVNSIGCYRLPIGYIAADLGWSIEQINEALLELAAVELIEWNQDEQIVRIIDFIRHDPPTNVKHAAAMAKDAFALTDCREKMRALEELLEQKWIADKESLTNERDRLAIAYQEGISPLPVPSPVPEPIPDPVPEPQPSSQRADSSRGARLSSKPKFVLPDWVPKEAWDKYAKMRGRKFTADARDLNLRKLGDLRDAGEDPLAVLEQAVERGWSGLFPVKTEVSNGSGRGAGRRQTAFDPIQAGAADAMRRVGGRTGFVPDDAEPNARDCAGGGVASRLALDDAARASMPTGSDHRVPDGIGSDASDAGSFAGSGEPEIPDFLRRPRPHSGAHSGNGLQDLQALSGELIFPDAREDAGDLRTGDEIPRAASGWR